MTPLKLCLYFLVGFLTKGSVFSQEECVDIRKGEHYIGRLNATRSGLPCLTWANLTFSSFNYSSVKEADSNYCRNYGNLSTPGCFAANNNNAWEFCNITQCDICDAHPCQNNGTCEERKAGLSFRCICPPGYVGTLCEFHEATIFCGEGWMMLESGCFKYHPERLGRHNAQNKCKFYDGDLPGRDFKSRMSVFSDMTNITSMFNSDIWTLFHSNYQNTLMKSGINISVSGSHKTMGEDFCLITNSSDLSGTLYSADCKESKSFACFKPKGRCPSNWYHHGNKCYLYKPFLLASYGDADQYCKTQNSSLIEPKSIEDQDFITKYVKRMAEIDETRLWIGLKKSTTEQWAWKSDDVALMYGNWYDYSSRQGFDCAYSDTDGNGKWRSDISCQTPLGVVCVSNITKYQKKEMVKPKHGSEKFLMSPLDSSIIYTIPDKLVTWPEALVLCKLTGPGDLLSLSSESESHLILGWLNAIQRKSYMFWTGGNSRDDSRGWQWTDQQPFKYVNFWHRGAPKNGGECLAISHGYYTGWLADRCSQYHQPICKMTFRKRRPTQITVNNTTVPSVTNTSYGCVPGWEDFDGNNCIKFFIKNVTQPEAKKACQKEEAHLISLQKGAQRYFMMYHIYTAEWNTPERYWIGLELDKPHRTFEWIDGSKVMHTAWGKHQPGQVLSRLSPRSKSCVYSDGTFMWYTASCNTVIEGFLCEKKMENIAATTQAPHEIGCNKGSFGYGAYCYSKENNTLSWTAAHASCKTQGGNLATVASREVQGFLSYTLSNDVENYWIGYKHEENKTATWSSGARVTFTYIEAKKSYGKRGQYVGCFWDNRTRILEPKMYGIRTVGQCLNICARDQKLYAGIEYQDECFCGNELRNFPRQADSDCQTKRCRGNYLEFCGGTWRIAIYNTGIVKDKPCVIMSMKPPPGLWHYRECTESNRYICEFPRVGFTTTTTPIPTTPPPRCPDSWMPHSQFCYKIFSEKRSWIDARAACRELGTDLVSIHSRGEFNFVRSKVRATSGPAWIGLNDRATENVFTWSDGSPLDFEDWKNNQPDNWYNNEHCCHMTSDYSNAYNDVPCSFMYPFMCKVKKGVSVNMTYSPVSIEKCKDPGFYFFRGFCYFIYNETTPIDYFEARRSCHDKHADLTGIHDLEETNFLMNLIWRFTNQNKIWIGLTELNDDFTYKWDDGSAVDFQNWADNEPNDHGGEERCVTMSKNIGVWSDYPCGMKINSFVCKKRNGTLVKPTPPAPVMIKGGCRTGFVPSPLNNKCYFVSNNTEDFVTWSTAQSKCKSFGKGFDLVSIKDADEMSFVTSLLKNHYLGRWIGIRDGVARSFQWSDNTELTYTNWMSGEPSGGNSKCGVLWTVIKSGQWDATNCNSKQGYICQGQKDPNLSSQVSTTCPNGYSEYYNRCFKFIKLSFNRKSAEVHCSIDGGRLASITGFFEHENLRILAKANSVDGFWIGLQSTNSTKSFVWDDSSPYIFTKWAPNEPSMKQQENCVMQSNGSWYDVSCDVTLPSLCEINRDPMENANQPIDCEESKYGFSTSMPIGSTCFYAVHDTSLNWLDANRACQSRGTLLASVLSVNENEHVHEYIRKLSQLSAHSYWIGLTRKITSDRPSGFGWYWIGGINLDYKRWLYNQPSSSLFDNMNQCAEMTFTGFWDDVSCSKKNRFICKRVVQESTTSPTTMSYEVTTETTEVPYTTKGIKIPISARQSQTLKDEGFPLGGIVGITVIIILVCVLGIISAYFISKRIREKKDGMSRVTGFENAIYKRASTTETEKFAEFS